MIYAIISVKALKLSLLF